MSSAFVDASQTKSTVTEAMEGTMHLHEIESRNKARTHLAERLRERGVESELLDPNDLSDDMPLLEGWQAAECDFFANDQKWQPKCNLPVGFPFGRTIGVFLDAYHLPP